MRITKTCWLMYVTSLACLLSGSCIQLPSEGEKPVLKTHVQEWRQEIIYQIMVDRFANGDVSNDFRVEKDAPARYHGGDWLGLEQHLDYIKALGVTTLWISPVVKNVETDAGVDGYHGYWAQDLTETNPHFGNIQSLRRFVKRAHDNGLRVVVDIVTNHMGQLFYYDINGNGQPDINISESGYKPGPDGSPIPVKHITEFDPDFDPRGIQSFTSLGEAGPAPVIFVYDPAANKLPAQPAIFQQPWAYHRMGRIYNYDENFVDQTTGERRWPQTEFGDFPGGLKDIATEIPDVRAALIDSYARWVEETDIDGFRIDTIKHVEHEFWQTFAPALRQRLDAQGKRNFFMFGESFDGDDARNGTYTKNEELDSVFYFSQKYQIIDEIFGRQSTADPKGSQSPTRKVEELWSQKTTNYGTQPHTLGVPVAPHKLLVNFMDNHDVSRFLYNRPDPVALRNSLLFLFTEEGIPCVYYGTEQEFSGGNDPANREDLWTTNYNTSGDTFRWIANLANLRKKYPALTIGDSNLKWVSDHTGQESDAGILAFERTGGDAGSSYALVIINTNSDHASSPSFENTAMQLALPEGTPMVDVLHNTGSYPVGAGGNFALEIPALSGIILVPQSQVN
jgi:alpha-amylase